MNFELPEPEPASARHRRVWSCLAVLTFALGVASLYRLGWLALYYTGRLPNLGAQLGYEGLDFWLRTLSTLPKVVAAAGLMMIAPDLGWRRRGFFYLICTVIDSLLWGVDCATELGLTGEDNPFPAWFATDEWLRYGIGTVVGWAEFGLVAGMAADVATAYGHEKAADAAKSLRSLATTGAVLWALFFLAVTRWNHPGPLRLRRMTHQLFLLWQSVRLIWTVCLIRLTLLSHQALAACGRTISDEFRERRRRDESAFEDAAR